MRFHLLLWLVLVAASAIPVSNGSESNGSEYLRFVRAQAAALRSKDRPPATAAQWQQRKTALREDLLQAWGGFPAEDVALQARQRGVIQRDGYRVEKVIFQTFPGVWMTANAYVPDRPGKMPALLMVHGHWRGAKQDPVVQARCIGAAKLGFFVLVVDAFGAGERGVGKALGEYHGDMTAATLLPTGLPLSGLQVYENMRAVDYLQARSEVDRERIGISGASGGGNQTMYAGAWDERLKAVVPVCSVGNYQAYLGAACCMCEVVPGALRFTEEWAVLGMAAPRALMVINATRDARQFSVAEAKISLELTKQVFETLGKPDNLRHAVFDSGHDYSQAMREAVYGWMSLHLKQQGDGSPVQEPLFTTEDPESLRWFPGESRPDDWVTIPRFAAAEAQRLLASRKTAPRSNWQLEKERLQTVLRERLLGGFPTVKSLEPQIVPNEDRGSVEFTFTPEPGITLKALRQNRRNHARVVVFVDLKNGQKAASSEMAREAVEAGWSVVTLDLRATGALAWPSDKIGRAPDHTSAQWGLWIGRPLLGQWVWDLRCLLDALAKIDEPSEVALVGVGPGGIVAMAAAALDDRITRVATIGTLASLVSDVPYENQRLGTIVPGMLRELGDLQDLAALVAPRPMLIHGGVRGDGSELELSALRELFERTEEVYSGLDGAEHFVMAVGDSGRLKNFLGSRR